MSSTDLHCEYERLRNELEQAYAAPVWNSRQIDRIANAITRIERAFMRRVADTRGLCSRQASSGLAMDKP